MPDRAAPALDPRIHPYKHDIAAAHLKGEVEADIFVEGKPHRVTEPLTDVLSDQMGEARTSQALYGETFMVYQTEGYWAWGQLMTDGYVGWLSALSLIASDGTDPTHVVSAPLTRATDKSIKVLGNGPMPMGAQLRVSDPSIEIGGSSARFAQSDAGALPADHLRSLSTPVHDWVAVAALFTNTPYVWGGRSALGIDCSALVQLAIQQAGIACPRDSDMQEARLGHQVERSDGLQRGDLAFWPGHVGIMLDDATLFHANAFAMATVAEPLIDVEHRIGEARTIKRLDQ
ncbi:MAG: C40 family peptidase [Rhizobiales bacterium]|nr:C40 family peptidase [Hyphomicrobiales bacterium]MBO6699217.1 C40 family peptidase [Hyphomicrobiales bacterium]MBO6736755.1 C40 family peptidase [Hyphomicrobiales bacterium]MBO6912171.1 C40 family peptidase [Hyphomicrobiales bacterium]MBO6957341.1 C40 family peptidase [Hyphomicrobiales bacterium]